MPFSKDWSFALKITAAVKYLILINVSIFLFDLLFHLKLSPLLGLTPALFWRGALWQPVTYMFLHAGIFHVLINMFILWMFGIALESTWGSRRFLKFFFICGISAGLLNAVVTPGSPIPTVGASGAIYGLLMAFGILFPNQLIYIWGVFPVKAKYFVIGVGVLELLTAMSVTRSGVAHVAHLGGMIFGLIYMKWGSWSRSLEYRRAKERQMRQLKAARDYEQEKETLQKEADKILDKINTNGLNSLSVEEHKRLKEVSQKMNELDRKR